jgi:hypothetical protein
MVQDRPVPLEGPPDDTDTDTDAYQTDFSSRGRVVMVQDRPVPVEVPTEVL